MVHDFLYWLMQQQAAIVHDHAIIYQQFHVLNDVRSEKDCLVFCRCIFPKVFHKQTAITRIQSHGKIIQNQQFRVLGKKQSQRHLRTLSARHGREFLRRKYLQLFQQFIIGLFLPFREKGRIKFLYLRNREVGMLHMPFQ